MARGIDVDSDFKAQFYNLQGVHINERKNNFYTLLKSTSPNLDKDQFDIQPRNFQERIFHIDVLIYFKQTEKLIEVLQEGIGILASKVLKQQWFFQEAFKNMKDDDIVNNFLSTLSYSLRMKVLKKLSLTLSEERMDNIFDLVLERYGLFIAKQFLFSCSSQKIINILRTHEITLSSDQLKRILHKDAKLLLVYFEEYKKNTGNEFDDYSFFNYLAWKHPELYFEFGLNDDKWWISLGYCTTQAVIRTNKEEVLKDLKNSRWNKAALVRGIKEFDKDYLFTLFPKDMDLRDVPSFLTKYPVKRQWEILSTAFKQAYKSELVEHLNKFNYELASFLPRDIKQKWAEVRYVETDELRYIKYYNPKTAFKLLKDKINLTSDINQRGILLKELIYVCYENQDYDTYEAVLKYICIRHRNEDKNVRANIISCIREHIHYHLLTENHWQYINEIIDIQRIRNESVVPFDITTEYLLFLYLKEQPVDEPVLQYVQDCLDAHRSLKLGTGQKEADRHIIKHIIKNLPRLQLKNYNEILRNMISDIIDFNREIKNDKILRKDFERLWIDLNLCEPIIEFIKTVLRKQELMDEDQRVIEDLFRYHCLYSVNPLKVINEDGFLKIIVDSKGKYKNCIWEVIGKSKRNKFENTLLHYYFGSIKEDYTGYSEEAAIKYFLVREPDIIAKYFSNILSLEIDYSSNLLDYNIIKRYSHLDLDKQAILYFKDLVSVDKEYNQKVKLLSALAIVMDSKGFLDLVQDYTPTTKKLDLKNKDQTEIYQCQCDIAKIFKKLVEPKMLAPVIIHFSQGDYLQSSLPALYKVLYHINERNTSYYLNILKDRAVSTRKHAFFLGFELLSVKEAMAIYSEVSNKETNISAQKYLFDAVLKYFLKNHLEFLLDIIFVNMNQIDKNNTELIEAVINSVNRIPIKYKPIFIEKVWDFLNILERQDVKVFNYRANVVRSINNEGFIFVSRLNKDFCEYLITNYFLTTSAYAYYTNNTIQLFVINYLLTYSNEQHFQFVFNLIKKFKDIHWKCNKEYSDYILNFFTKAYSILHQYDNTFLNLFNTFWQRLFTFEECFSECILLKLMFLYKGNINIETFSKEVDKLFQELINRYGTYISGLLIDSIKRFYWSIETNDDFNLQQFVLYLLKSNCNDFNYLTAYSIIKERPYTKDFHKVVDILKADVDNGAARIYSNILLREQTY